MNSKKIIAIGVMALLISVAAYIAFQKKDAIQSTIEGVENIATKEPKSNKCIDVVDGFLKELEEHETFFLAELDALNSKERSGSDILVDLRKEHRKLKATREKINAFKCEELDEEQNKSLYRHLDGYASALDFVHREISSVILERKEYLEKSLETLKFEKELMDKYYAELTSTIL